MKPVIERYTLIALGWLSLLLGLIGIVLPLLPTTPFVLLAAFCFSKSSPLIHRKLMANKYMGPIIKDWEQNGVIKLRTKWVATITMLLLVSYPLFFKIQNLLIQVTIVIVMLCVLVFIWTRPSR
ncbi:YbaN family protein [Glaciecola sp. MF2-115]|uniref:YbaN family protein n=1 Tax=Glaciecola sp. MF2-115 TaxID=3384827 RepID=UPI0039A34981|mmetsp:Transcript_14767/g.47061  ORF Transcript_14767/g.47061 Transcript_14767/m.47061 type:complete len:124 (-) Transcript_14767:4556-4927(-)